MTSSEMTTTISEEEVLIFLNKIEDPNPIHREPVMVLPGMYGLSTIESLVNRPISSIDVDFKSFTEYPCILMTKFYENNEEATFEVLNGSTVLYSGILGFDNNEDLGLNSDKLLSVYKVGGALLGYNKTSFEEGQSGIYLSQSMRFQKGYNPLDGELEFGERVNDGRKVLFPVKYSLRDRVLAEGESKVRPISEKLLDRMMRKVKVAK